VYNNDVLIIEKNICLFISILRINFLRV